MNKKTLQKIESQLQEQKKIPSDKKEVIRTEIFYNISLAIMIMGYFFLLIYQLSDKSFDYKICSTIMLLFTISIVNSTIIGFTFMVVMHIESYALGLIIGFVLLILLTYSIYEIIGRYYQKKGRK